MKTKKIIIQNIDDSISLYENNILIKNYKPQYSFKKSYEYFDIIIKNSLNKINLLHTKNSYWSYLSLILAPIFWHNSLNFIKYKKFFDKYGFMIPAKDFKNDDLLQVKNSYRRAVLFYKNDSFLKKLITNIRFVKSHLFFIIWILINFILRNKNKIWIDKLIISDFRFNSSELRRIIYNSNFLEILNKYCAPTSLSFHKKEFYDGIEKEILKRISGYKLWTLAIKWLKPKKIIVRDDLDHFQGLLLAAKINKIKIIGITHGTMSQWQSYVNGPRTFCILYPVLFDKLYLWHSSFINLLKSKTTMYNANQIKLCGWLQDFKYTKNIIEKKDNLYVLYPFERHTDFISINELLTKFIKLNKKIIIKKYPGWKNYQMFKNMDFELVEDFEPRHLNNTFAVISLTSTMAFEFLSRNYIVVYPKKSGYFLFEDLNVSGLISDKDFFKKKENFRINFKLDKITDEFRNEFI